MELCLSPVQPPACKLVLSPAQQSAAEAVLDALVGCDLVVLQADAGRGKTSILQHVHAKTGGAYLGMGELMKTLATHQPLAIEEAWLSLMDASLSGADLVIMDDLHLLANVSTNYNYPRHGLFEVALTAVLEQARKDGKKLVFGFAGEIPDSIEERAQSCKIEDFTAADYAAIGQVYLNSKSDGVDYAKVHRFAPELNIRQLRTACLHLSGVEALDTAQFIDHLASEGLTSNVEIKEVEPVDWNDLKGVDDVIRALEAKIALPLENDDLAIKFDLKPKRGVLLAGPPGTGKTTIGRALAHRLKSKFFLIDGTVVAGTRDFYCEIRSIFGAAKRSAPSIIFIDDADVLFEGEERSGLYRYLLTMLDGLESASVGRVCVMLTAMDVSSLPAALVRSGRIELWLETKLPDERAREVILSEKIAKLPEPLALANARIIAHATRGFTGADLKAVVEDGKLLFAHDYAQGLLLRPMEDYFLQAIRTIRKNRRSYARRKPSQVGEGVKYGFLLEERIPSPPTPAEACSTTNTTPEPASAWSIACAKPKDRA
ncbi:MAG TPA: AAA family ATPase [Bryobacteraceae bacterium]|nr:AAA family ATPase [Bryobacteraceae bacterium]